MDENLERLAFVKWLKKEYPEENTPKRYRNPAADQYIAWDVQCHWKGWLARSKKNDG